jgi:hypothetical protein
VLLGIQQTRIGYLTGKLFDKSDDCRTDTLGTDDFPIKSQRLIGGQKSVKNYFLAREKANDGHQKMAKETYNNNITFVLKS